MSSGEMSMDAIMEDEESFVSKTDATIYGASYISGRTESLISDPNIPKSSSTSENEYEQQISTAAGGGTEDSIVSSCASSSWFKNNNDKQTDQQEIRLFNVDFRALSGTQPQNYFARDPTQPQNYFARDYQWDIQVVSSFRKFGSDLGPKYNVQLFSPRDRRQSMLNKSIAFYRKLYQRMMPEQIQAPHMILAKLNAKMPEQIQAPHMILASNIRRPRKLNAKMPEQIQAPHMILASNIRRPRKLNAKMPEQIQAPHMNLASKIRRPRMLNAKFQ